MPPKPPPNSGLRRISAVGKRCPACIARSSIQEGAVEPLTGPCKAQGHNASKISNTGAAASALDSPKPRIPMKYSSRAKVQQKNPTAASKKVVSEHKHNVPTSTRETGISTAMSPKTGSSIRVRSRAKPAGRKDVIVSNRSLPPETPGNPTKGTALAESIPPVAEASNQRTGIHSNEDLEDERNPALLPSVNTTDRPFARPERRGSPMTALSMPSLININMDRARIHTAVGDVGSHNRLEINRLEINNHGVTDKKAEALRSLERYFHNKLFLDARYELMGREKCYPRTRVHILERIQEWALSHVVKTTPTQLSQQCLCITGIPVSGKSTVAATLASRLKDCNNLYAQFFISRIQKSADPANIFPTIAYQLAEKSTDAAMLIVKALEEKPSLVDGLSVEQGKKLFIDPISVIRPTLGPGTITIIIDALDELSEQGHPSFVAVLAELVPHLPHNTRLILSSRPENNVSETIACLVEKLELHTRDSQEDVTIYIGGRLKEIVPKMDHWNGWPSEADVLDLSVQASGLFAWAATALKFISSEIEEQGAACRNLVMASIKDEGLKDLDDLYGFILRNVITKDRTVLKFRQIVGCLVILGEPLDIGALLLLLRISNDEFDMIHFFARLRSVLISGMDKIHTTTIPQMHKSFVDYITSARAGDKFRIHKSLHHSNILSDSLEAMRSLHFNMFALESSYLRNDDIPHLDKRVDRIPRHLLYSCDYWVYHMQRGQGTNQILLDAVDHFMKEGFLAWLEVLSLRMKTEILAPSMAELAQWMKGRNKELEAFVRDAARFISVYLPMMCESVPHIYLSALPLSPSSSAISKHYSIRYPNTISSPNKPRDWDPELLVINCFEPVYSIALSPIDAKYIVSGHKKSIHLWDMYTGARVSHTTTSGIGSGLFTSTTRNAPFGGHENTITALAFSTDNKTLISCSDDRSIRIWNAETGVSIAVIENAHDDGITCIHPSVDGKHLVSGSTDATLNIWNMKSQENVLRCPVRGHEGCVRSVAFSPDNQSILSMSDDGTLRIWDATTGQVTGPLLQIQKRNTIDSVAISPDGRRVACGLDNKSIVVHDTITGEIVAGPFRGHTREVLSLAFSADGARIVSGSDDNTVIVWDSLSKAGEIVAGPLYGHSYCISAVMFSHNAKHVISASLDRTIRIWDLEREDKTAGAFQELPPGGSIGFSSDGNEVLFSSISKSGSVYSMTIQHFEVGTGNAKRSSSIKCRAGADLAVFSSSGQHLACAGYSSSIQICNVITKDVVAYMPVPTLDNRVVWIEFTKDGTTFVSVCRNYARQPFHTITWTSIKTGECAGQCILEEISCHLGGELEAMALSPDGNTVLTVFDSEDDDEKTRIRSWSGLRKKRMTHDSTSLSRSFCGHTERIVCIAYSPTKSQFASGSWDNTVRVWSNTKANIAILRLDHPNTVSSIAYSPDGRFIVSGCGTEGTVRIWDATTGNIVAGPFCSFTDMVTSLIFSPDGKRLASYSKKDGTIRVWNTAAAIAMASSKPKTSKDLIRFKDNTELRDGWVLGPHSELLLWIPPPHRKRLWRPSNACVIGKNSLQLDWLKAVQGEEWQSCCNARLNIHR